MLFGPEQASPLPRSPLTPPWRRTLISFSPPSSPSLTEVAFLCLAGVDVPIHLYSLYSDPKTDWTTTYAEQPEVLAYYDALVDKYHLRGNFAFDTEYVGSEWHDSTQSHTLTLRRSDGSTYTHDAEIIISANGVCSIPFFLPLSFSDRSCAMSSMLTIRVLLTLLSSDDPGPLSTPQIPQIRGLDQFEGTSFHNLRWDPTVDLKNKRVAVVGNGSSGIQLVVSPPSSFWPPLPLIR